MPPKELPTLPTVSPLRSAFMKIGFIGQGWIGKNYANDFENRGYKTVRYALEAPYVGNKEKIKDCDIVFIAVPTPTTPAGFDAGIVEESLKLVGPGKIAVIKSTVIPGSTKRLQEMHPNIIVLYAPEFLSEATAAEDAAHPFANIIGLPQESASARAAAESVMGVLPKAPFNLTSTSTEAEFIKYSHNINGYFQVMLANVLYDAAQRLGANWEVVRGALDHDPYIANRYGRPVHKSGRGAGGGCFIKDFAAFRELYLRLCPEDARGHAMLAALEAKNVDLLTTSGKDLHLLHGVYGPEPLKTRAYRIFPPLRHAEKALVAGGSTVVLLGALSAVFMLAGILR